VEVFQETENVEKYMSSCYRHTFAFAFEFLHRSEVIDQCSVLLRTRLVCFTLFT
jgi:hypothetical protein